QLKLLHELLQKDDLEIDAVSGPQGRSALLRAVVAGAPLAVQMLIEAGADIKLKDAENHDAFQLACQNTESQRAETHNTIMRVLASAMNKNNWIPEDGRCAIEASFQANPSRMQEMLQCGLDANQRFRSRPLLHHAIVENRLPLVKLLVKNGA